MVENKNLPDWNCQQCLAPISTEHKTSTNHLPLDYNLYCDFPVKIKRSEHLGNGPIFEEHWHEQIQILYFEQGEAFIHCNANTYTISPGDIMIINSNEIHYGLTNSDHLVYYIIKVDFNFLFSNQQDLCQTNYITPLSQGYIRFQNQISQNHQLTETIKKMITEYTEQNLGYELSIKAHIYHIFVHLFRQYQKASLRPAAQERQQKAMYQLRTILQYIEDHYNETIHLNELSSLAHMSRQHFCRIFKQMTGKRPMDYINLLRINKAVSLLAENQLNISEIAMAVGFDDSNYFSRIFKKYRKTSPSALKNKKLPNG